MFIERNAKGREEKKEEKSFDRSISSRFRLGVIIREDSAWINSINVVLRGWACTRNEILNRESSFRKVDNNEDGEKFHETKIFLPAFYRVRCETWLRVD